jgi:hypothetical protein
VYCFRVATQTSTDEEFADLPRRTEAYRPVAANRPDQMLTTQNPTRRLRVCPREFMARSVIQAFPSFAARATSVELPSVTFEAA